MNTPVNWKLRTIIVPDSLVHYARKLTAIIAGESGQGMYSAAVASKDNPYVVTHWVSSGLILEEFSSLLPLLVQTEEGEVLQEGKPKIVATYATTHGFETTEEKVKELFDLSYVIEQDFFSYADKINMTLLKEQSESLI